MTETKGLLLFRFGFIFSQVLVIFSVFLISMEFDASLLYWIILLFADYSHTLLIYHPKFKYLSFNFDEGGFSIKACIITMLLFFF